MFDIGPSPLLTFFNELIYVLLISHHSLLHPMCW